MFDGMIEEEIRFTGLEDLIWKEIKSDELGDNSDEFPRISATWINDEISGLRPSQVLFIDPIDIAQTGRLSSRVDLQPTMSLSLTSDSKSALASLSNFEEVIDLWHLAQNTFGGSLPFGTDYSATFSGDIDAYIRGSFGSRDIDFGYQIDMSDVLPSAIYTDQSSYSFFVYGMMAETFVNDFVSLDTASLEVGLNVDLSVNVNSLFLPDFIGGKNYASEIPALNLSDQDISLVDFTVSGNLLEGAGILGDYLSLQHGGMSVTQFATGSASLGGSFFDANWDLTSLESQVEERFSTSAFDFFHWTHSEISERPLISLSADIDDLLTLAVPALRNPRNPLTSVLEWNFDLPLNIQAIVTLLDIDFRIGVFLKKTTSFQMTDMSFTFSNGTTSQTVGMSEHVIFEGDFSNQSVEQLFVDYSMVGNLTTTYSLELAIDLPFELLSVLIGSGIEYSDPTNSQNYQGGFSDLHFQLGPAYSASPDLFNLASIDLFSETQSVTLESSHSTTYSIDVLSREDSPDSFDGVFDLPVMNTLKLSDPNDPNSPLIPVETNGNDNLRMTFQYAQSGQEDLLITYDALGGYDTVRVEGNSASRFYFLPGEFVTLESDWQSLENALRLLDHATFFGLGSDGFSGPSSTAQFHNVEAVNIRGADVIFDLNADKFFRGTLFVADWSRINDDIDWDGDAPYVILPSGISGSAERFHLYLGSGNDVIVTRHQSRHDDFLDGGDGDDVFQTFGGADVLRGGSGNDQLTALWAAELNGGSGNDILSTNASMIESPVQIVLDGGSGEDLLKLTLGYSGPDPVDFELRVDSGLGAVGGTSTFGDIRATLIDISRDNEFQYVFSDKLSDEQRVISIDGIEEFELQLNNNGDWSSSIFFSHNYSGSFEVREVEFRDGTKLSDVFAADWRSEEDDVVWDLGVNTRGIDFSATPFSRYLLLLGDGNDQITNFGGRLFSNDNQYGNTFIEAGGGNDYIAFRAGVHEVFGGAGDDTIDLYESIGNAYGGEGNDTLKVLVRPDQYSSQLVDGGSGNDFAEIWFATAGRGHGFYPGSEISVQFNALSGQRVDFDSEIALIEDILNSWSLGDSVDYFLTDPSEGGFEAHVEVRNVESVKHYSGSADFGVTVYMGQGQYTGAGLDLFIGDLRSVSQDVYIDASKRVRGEQSLSTSELDGATIIENYERYFVYLGSGDDTIISLGFDDFLHGGLGDDQLIAGAGNDVLVGGTGDDALAGGTGLDEYRFSPGFGSDTIFDLDLAGVISFSGISIGRLSLEVDLFDLIIRIDGSRDYIRVSDYFFDDPSGKEWLIETNGQQTSIQDLNLNSSYSPDVDVIVRGGTSFDILRGTHSDDYLNGYQGDDRLAPYGGNDIVIGGSQDDTVYYGLGGESATEVGVLINLSDTSVTLNGVTVAAATAHDIWGGVDELHSIENAVGADFVQADTRTNSDFSASDWIMGSEEENVIEGLGGSDFLFGGAGNDYLNGGAGNDQISGDSGGDFVEGGAGDDLIFGGDQNDNLFGGDGNDQILGQRGADFLYGGTGNDLVLGGNRNDRLFGEDGNDRVFGGNDQDIVSGGSGRDIVRGGNGDDEISGDAGDDVLFGGTGRDIVLGGDGNDLLWGRGGFDVLNGGAGDDTLEGGLQADQFIFEDGFGNDTITDFAALNNAERIDLSGVSEITDFTDLTDNHMNQVGTDVVIDDGLGNTITLLGVNISDLDVVDFVF